MTDAPESVWLTITDPPYDWGEVRVGDTIYWEGEDYHPPNSAGGVRYIRFDIYMDEIARRDAELKEARRRRDDWRKKAEGFEAVRLALREKVGEPWPPHMSRIIWAGLAADEKKRADDAEAENRRLHAEIARLRAGSAE